MDFAPFKKPSRLAGLFSYRSVIPPSPHEILLAQIFMGGPGRPVGGKVQAAYRLRRVFSFHEKAHSALTLPLNLGPRAAAAAAVGLETRLRAQSFPRETLLAQTFAGAPAARSLTRGWRVCYAILQIV